MLSVLRVADVRALPVYLLLNFGWLRRCRELLTKFPSARFIFGYGGFPYFDALWKIIKPFPNATIDLTSLHMTPRYSRHGEDARR